MPEERTSTYDIETILQKLGITSTFDLDVLLQKSSISTYDADIVLKQIISLPTLIDLAIRGSISYAYFMDLITVNVMSSSYSIDVELIHGKLYSIDVGISYLSYSDYLLDTLIKETGVHTDYSLDVKIANINVKQYLIDVTLIGAVATYPLDVILVGIRTSYFLVDLIIKQITSTSYLLDVSLPGRFTSAYLLDVILYEEVPKLYWARGSDAKIKIGELEIGCASEVNVRINKEVEEYYSVENPLVRLVEGAHKIEGSIRKAWVNTYYLRLLGMSEDGFSWDSSKEFTLEFRARRDIINPQTITLYNCRFTRSRISIPQSGWLEEEYDFIAKRVSTQWGPMETPPCPPDGEYISNGEFNDWLFYWEHSGEVYVWSEGCPPDYYCAIYYYNSYIKQDIQSIKGEAVPVNCVTSFSFKVKKEDCPQVTVRLTITYSDNSTSYHDFYVDSWWWQGFNALPYLSSGKSISKIEFRSMNNSFGIDSISLVVGYPGEA